MPSPKPPATDALLPLLPHKIPRRCRPSACHFHSMILLPLISILTVFHQIQAQAEVRDRDKLCRGNW
ncbi:hypothetical protein SETIT_5G363800v2 [Setaria italica]|uniref:Uncharacterized protein n=2 Tax=Setaria TaxID=4554 RepID=A0A368RCH2_SETIT|nr:hypothetical protein SETIT_5G363800v2 [Setaria italica]TKW17472.1 hypothetical protein SEVIR_5G369300v2 [Setaria viridis]